MRKGVGFGTRIFFYTCIYVNEREYVRTCVRTQTHQQMNTDDEWSGGTVGFTRRQAQAHLQSGIQAKASRRRELVCRISRQKNSSLQQVMKTHELRVRFMWRHECMELTGHDQLVF
jgi:hypothetical protein